MTVDELGEKLMDKSSEVYWDKCSSSEPCSCNRYWEGWSDALEWVAQLISDGCLEYLELERPIWIGEHNIDGKRKVFYKYPSDWSEEQKEEWRREHGG